MFFSSGLPKYLCSRLPIRTRTMGLYILESYKGANLFTRIALMLLTGALYVGWYAYCTASWGRTFPTADSDYFVGYGVWRIGDNQFSNSNPTASTGNNAPLPTIVTTDGWLLSKCLLSVRECLLVGCLLACLTSQQHASVSQGRICSDNFTCCHTEIEVADQKFYLT